MQNSTDQERLTIFNDYERIGENYAKKDNYPFNAFYERPCTLSLLPDIKDLNVLDIGCGAGWYTEWLVEHGATVTAVDFSQKLATYTQKRVPKASVFHADISKPLDFLTSTSFDLVLAPLVIHYVKNWDIPMGEFNRVLRQNGRLVFSTHHPFLDWVLLNGTNYFETSFIEDEWEDFGKVHFYRRSLTDICNSVTDTGFLIEKIIEPFPTKEFLEKDPKNYEKVTKNPWFLVVRAVKMRTI